ncbi:6-phosphogluconate dehydrogenase, partial [Acidithiobacillus ferrooxidans]|nr:6-phosphogluconate dehydrogenase [Acidithiobacillus ferrooxidans]
TPRVLWLMLPAGEVTQSHIDSILPLLSKNDILINGANAFYEDSIAQSQKVEAAGIRYIDAGVSGGIWGL